MINNVVLVGRIANEPETQYAQSTGKPVTKFRLAVGRGRKGEDGKEVTDWLNIVCFDQVAEFVDKYMDKGSLVGVTGRIQSRTWEGNDGKRNYMVEIAAGTVQALESKREADWRRENRAQRDAGGEDGDPRSSSGSGGGGGSSRGGYGGGDNDGPLGDDEDPFGDQ